MSESIIGRRYRFGLIQYGKFCVDCSDRLRCNNNHKEIVKWCEGYKPDEKYIKAIKEDK